MRAVRRLLLAAGLFWWHAAAAAEPSATACATVLAPPFDDPPAVRNWTPADAQGRALANACLGWAEPTFQQMVALAGRFRFDGTADELAGRFGAISSLEGLRFWSVLKQRWLVWITKAQAVTGPDAGQTRPDFAVDELRSQRNVYFAEEDSGSSGRVAYRLRVVQWQPDRLVVEMENVSPVRFMLMELFAPGELRFGYVLQRTGPGSWGFYGLVRTGAGASWLAGGHQDGYENRLAAVFRHIAGIPADREPPVVRGPPAIPAVDRDGHG